MPTHDVSTNKKKIYSSSGLKTVLTTWVLTVFSLNALALECVGTINNIESDSASCGGFTSYQSSDNPNYWICSDSQKSDDLLSLAYAMQTQVKTEINQGGSCSGISEHYLTGVAVSVAYDEFLITAYEVGYLVVGGGGSGGYGSTDLYTYATYGGGGGAGGVRTGSKLVEKGSAYSIVIGAGGVAPTSAQSNGFKGGNSSFDDIIAAGGGYGGNGNSANGGSGGSGGGGGSGTCSYYSDPAGSGGQGNSPNVTPAQGRNGGSGHCYSSQAGGGGGAGSAGANGAQSWPHGVGGIGITWEGQGTFAKGGSGAADYTTAAGANGTGNGGDGGIYSPYAPNGYPRKGGSDIVILKIPVDEYSGNVTGSPTVTEIGLYKYVKFTSNGSYSG